MPRLEPGLEIPDHLKKPVGRPPKHDKGCCTLCGKLKTSENTGLHGRYLHSMCKQCSSLVTNVRDLQQQSPEYLQGRIDHHQSMITRCKTVLAANPDQTVREICEGLLERKF